MARYTFSETVTLLTEVEADNESEAWALFNEMSVRDFTEVDCGPAAPSAAPRIVNTES